MRSLVIIQKEWLLQPMFSFCPTQNGEEVLSVENTRENREAICFVVQYWNCVKNFSATTNLLHMFVDILKSLSLDSNFPYELETFEHVINSLKSNNPVSIEGFNGSWKTTKEVNEQRFPFFLKIW